MERLRPQRVIEVLDHTFRVYRANFLTFVALVAVISVPLNLISYLVQSAESRSEVFITTTDTFGNTTTEFNDSAFTGSIVVLLVSVVAGFLQIVVVNAVITQIASENLLGRQRSVIEALGDVAGRLLPLGLALVLLGIVAGIGFFFFGVIGLLCLLPLLGLPMVLYFSLVAYFFLVPVMVLERVSFGQGMSRAMALGKARFWQTFGFAVGVALITTVANFALTVVGALLSGAAGAGLEDLTQTNPVSTALNTLVSVLIAPVLPIGLTLMYYDTRMRVEGLDLSLQLLPEAMARPAALPSPKLPLSFATSKDMLNILCLTLGFIGLLIAYFAFIFLLIGILAL
ncbi:MAG: hypothetical protein HC915_18790 [Anaerolineae bacterium]|nr:hypothetical protein [Anaerolineae bacterium]